MSERDKLLAEIESFLDRTGMGPTQFSVESTGERALMTRLKKGADVTLGTADRIRAFMRQYGSKKKRRANRLVERATA